MAKDVRAFSSFSVKDLTAARDFYSKILGLKITEGPEGLRLQIGPDTTVFVYAKPNHTPASFTILNFPVPNVEEAVKDLAGRGVKFERYDEPDLKTDKEGIYRGRGPKIAWFKDPSGNIVSVLDA